ncbi:hypothetical protein [Luteococcus sp. OSA5]|uniref:hypothetical protein n=1 Tax=Luteococcus sp. OSA5 TaxID=3401630 RepID=UPI003B4337C6
MRTTSLPRLVATALAAGTIALAPAAPALAQVDSPARPMPANQTDDCLEQGKVWLVVQDSKKELLVDKCVEVAETGEKLLSEAGVKTTKDAKGQMICTIEGEPQTCPAAFDGNYWHYYTAQKGGKWTYSQVGADQSKPKAGTLEGWCYGKECTPAMPQQGAASASATDSASTTPGAQKDDVKKSSDPIVSLVVAAIVVGLLAAYFTAKRRKS